MYSVILYYNFKPIADVQSFIADHRTVCKELELKGRIYVSDEGINGTLAGKSTDVESYKIYLRGKPGFSDTAFKQDDSDHIPFAKMIVKKRPEIVSLKADEFIEPGTEGVVYLEPSEWRRVMESGEDYVMIDVRNDYESKIGHFEGALLPDVKNFYDFPKWLDEADIDKDKKVLMYCTGGIRCEKFSVYMRKQGYKDVNQLHGGIINYGKLEGGVHFKGKCFVFDDRLVVPVNPDDEEPISNCEITGVPCDTYINCANMECNKLFICSEEGAVQMEGCCSESCKNSEKRRPFNPENAYAPFRKWYHYFGPEFKDRQRARAASPSKG
ncbi:MAG: rhodanese-related sulfurtransferase [Bacteroidetes bacterium]|nr:rhodanese-related sulfurtransferase [Bacteroidota bacterium]MCH8524617.1 rhodanese-related sulfurtransferase [Balneolales bacterium]